MVEANRGSSGLPRRPRPFLYAASAMLLLRRLARLINQFQTDSRKD